MRRRMREAEEDEGGWTQTKVRGSKSIKYWHLDYSQGGGAGRGGGEERQCRCRCTEPTRIASSVSLEPRSRTCK